ncbi:MAG: hypothetical protein EBZ77_06970, partial [Chitinophagia bacterium]|nr:hypothetical protein [Chitinophagia bacterium]
MKRQLFFFLLVLCGTFQFASGQSSSCPPNIDFEYGSTTVWTYAVGSCCPISVGSYTSAVSGRHTLVSGTGTDPYGFFSIVPPSGGTYALRLGNSSVGAEAEAARYYLHIPSGTIDYALVYRYAVVLNDGGSSHDSTVQPRFEVHAYDSATGAPITCAQYKYVASSSIPGFHTSLIASDVLFKTWTTETINLSGFAGRTVILDFETGDCAYGGHFGYAYIDASCGLFSISTVGCDSSAAYLTAPSGFSHYEWYDSTDFTHTVDTFQTASITMPSSPRTYAVILFPFSGFGCRDTLYTHVYPSRLTLNKSNDTSLCFGGGNSVTLTTGATDIPGAMPLTYTWYPASTLSCSTCANPVATPTATTTYYFRVDNAVGCFTMDSIRILGNALATTVSSTSTSCYGYGDGTAYANITAGTAPYTYNWATFPPQTTATATGLYAGTYYVTVSDVTGCSGTYPVVVRQPNPNRINIGGHTDPSTCNGTDGAIILDSLLPGTNDTITYTYNGIPQSFIARSSSTGTISLTGLPKGIYGSFTVRTSGCPYNTTGTVTLVDPPIPPAPVITPQTYCQFETAVPAAASGSSLLWSGNGFSASPTAPTPSTATAHIDTYYVTQTIAGCVSNPARDIIRIKAKPGLPPTLDTTFCQYANATRLVAVGDSLRWYSTISGGVAIDSVPKPPTDIVGVTTWYVDQTHEGCTSDRAPINVTVLYLPDFSIHADRTSICQGDTIHLSYSGSALVQPGYQWSILKGMTYIASSARDSSITARFDSTRTQTIILRASDYSGRCFAYDTIKVNVVVRPTASFYLNQNICEGDSISLALSERSSNADHYTWDFDHANIITASSNTGGPYRISWTTPGVKIIKMNAYTVEGCESKDIIDTVRVLPLPNARIFAANNGRICLEDSVYLSAEDSMNYERNLDGSTGCHPADNCSEGTCYPISYT